MTAALTALADPIAANNFGDTREGGLAGPMGLFIISLLAIGTVLLIRNMNKRLRRLPRSFPAPGDAVTRDAATPAAGAKSGATGAPDTGAARRDPNRTDVP
jgi:hypothetical protein